MARSSRVPTLPDRLSRTALIARNAVQTVAFWTGVLLPLAYGPLLLLVEHGQVGELGLVTRLVVANAAACVVGHGHDPTRDRTGRTE